MPITRHHRRSIRLRGYDYRRPGAYFVTIAAHRGARIFGSIVGEAMQLNEAGGIVQAAWDALPTHFPSVSTDAFVVMPDHLHGIVIIGSPTRRTDVARRDGDVRPGAGLKPAPTLTEIIRALKTFSARRINAMRGVVGVPVWQRNYYEHIIRDTESLHRIRQYIIDNPRRWAANPP